MAPRWARSSRAGLHPEAAAANAMQLRVNMEVMDENGRHQADRRHAIHVRSACPAPGCASDTFGCSGYKTSAAFDSLLAKVIVHGRARTGSTSSRKATRTLRESASVASHQLPFLGAVLAHPDSSQPHHTGIIDTHVAALVHVANDLSAPNC